MDDHEPPEPPTARPFIPATRELGELRQASAGCRGCHLYQQATQTVFGEGSATAALG